MEIKERLKNIEYYNFDKSKTNSIQINLNEYNYNHSPILISTLKDSINQSGLIKFPSFSSENNINLLNNLSIYLNINNDQILLTNSTNISISNILKLYATNKSKIILFVPTNTQYEEISNIFTDKIIKIKLENLKTGNQDRQLDLFNLSDSFNNNRIICFLCNPNDPTGYEWSEIELKRMFKTYPNVLFIIDETYIDFSKLAIEEVDIFSCTNCINEFNNIIILRSFSNSFGLAGLGIEYIISNRLNILSLEKITSHIDIIEFSKIAANNVLENILFYRDQINSLFHDKYILIQFCKKNKIKVIDTKCNFILIYSGKFSNKLKEIFLENNIIVNLLNNNYSHLLDGYIRISMYINYTYIIISILEKNLDNLSNII